MNAEGTQLVRHVDRERREPACRLHARRERQLDRGARDRSGDDVLTILAAIGLGVLVLLAGNLPFNVLNAWNQRAGVAVPWAILPAALYLWAYWQFIGGRWGASDRSREATAGSPRQPVVAARVGGLAGSGPARVRCPGRIARVCGAVGEPACRFADRHAAWHAGRHRAVADRHGVDRRGCHRGSSVSRLHAESDRAPLWPRDRGARERNSLRSAAFPDIIRPTCFGCCRITSPCPRSMAG